MDWFRVFFKTKLRFFTINVKYQSCICPRWYLFLDLISLSLTHTHTHTQTHAHTHTHIHTHTLYLSHLEPDVRAWKVRGKIYLKFFTLSLPLLAPGIYLPTRLLPVSQSSAFEWLLLRSVLEPPPSPVYHAMQQLVLCVLSQKNFCARLKETSSAYVRGSQPFLNRGNLTWA